MANRTPQAIYEEIVAETPDFESKMPKLSDLVANDPVMKICRAGPAVFDYWLTQVNSHERHLKSLYNGISKNDQLVIANAGAAVWNYWQSMAQGDAIVVDMQSLLSVGIRDFAGFHFLNKVEFPKETPYGNVDFSGVTFSNEVDFSGATFSDEAYFLGATFARQAHFSGVTFSDKTYFSEATFAHQAHFSGATFSDETYFSGVTFAHRAYFSGVIFSDETHFLGATFFDESYFSGAIFFDEADFVEVTFSKPAEFGVVTFDGETYFSRAIFSRAADFGEVTFSKEADFAGAIFCRIANFAEAKYCSKADFRNVDFQSYTIFQRCVFEKEPPIFHNAKIHPDASFLGANWPKSKDIKSDQWQSKEELLEEWQRSYRTLKLAFAQHQSVREEQEFGRKEMEVEARLMWHTKKWGRALYLTLYGTLADYGYSAKRPGVWLLGLFAVGVLLALGGMDCSWDDAVRLSLSYTLPPFNLLKKTADSGYWFLWFEAQRLLSYLCWFLIGLAWRNQAKSK